MVHKLGLNKENVYDDLRAAVVAAPQFRWVFVHVIPMCLVSADLTGLSRAERRWSFRGGAIL